MFHGGLLVAVSLLYIAVLFGIAWFGLVSSVCIWFWLVLSDPASLVLVWSGLEFTFPDITAGIVLGCRRILVRTGITI